MKLSREEFTALILMGKTCRECIFFKNTGPYANEASCMLRQNGFVIKEPFRICEKFREWKRRGEES